MTHATSVSLKATPKSAVDLADFPLAEDQILEGNPQAKIWIHAQSPDLKVTQGVWSCTAGKFSWDFTWDEFLMVLEGEMTITPQDGEPVTLKEGDFVNFPLGLRTKWHVPHFVRKTFVLRTPEPLAL